MCWNMRCHSCGIEHRVRHTHSCRSERWRWGGERSPRKRLQEARAPSARRQTRRPNGKTSYCHYSKSKTHEIQPPSCLALTVGAFLWQRPPSPRSKPRCDNGKPATGTAPCLLVKSFVSGHTPKRTEVSGNETPNERAESGGRVTPTRRIPPSPQKATTTPSGPAASNLS